MSSSSFALLRLPLVALREIIEKTELYEQCKLSLCSKRMYHIVKHFRGKSTMSLKVYSIKDYTKVSLFSQKCSGDEVTFRVRAKGDIYCWETNNIEKLQSRFKETERLFSCENTIEGTKFLVEFLCDLFAVKIKKVEVVDNNIWMLDFVEERQGAFSYDAEVWNSYNGTDEQLRHILLDLNPRSLQISHEASNQFRIENFHKKYENLTIYGGTWVTVEILCQLDCVKIEIPYKYFSDAEINRYLKHVLRGGAPRLRKFRAEIQRPAGNVIMDGIQELLTGMEQGEDEDGNWMLKGTVAREEGLMVVSITYSSVFVYLEIKET